MIIAALLADLIFPLRRSTQVAALVVLLVWPVYQFASWSFDSRLLPRSDTQWGPLIFSKRDLEAESLEWMPTYTFPANPARWPNREVLAMLESHTASSDERARVHVAGSNPYFNVLTVSYEARLAQVSFMFDRPFTSDYDGADFIVTVLANRRYGPTDNRPTVEERALANGAAPFTQIGTLPLPDGGNLRIYEADRRLRVSELTQ